MPKWSSSCPTRVVTSGDSPAIPICDERFNMDSKSGKGDWRSLCEAVSCEQNSERLMELVNQLLSTLDESMPSKNLAYQDVRHI